MSNDIIILSLVFMYWIFFLSFLFINLDIQVYVAYFSEMYDVIYFLHYIKLKFKKVLLLLFKLLLF